MNKSSEKSIEQDITKLRLIQLNSKPMESQFQLYSSRRSLNNVNPLNSSRVGVTAREEIGEAIEKKNLLNALELPNHSKGYDKGRNNV